MTLRPQALNFFFFSRPAEAVQAASTTYYCMAQLGEPWLTYHPESWRKYVGSLPIIFHLGESCLTSWRMAWPPPPSPSILPFIHPSLLRQRIVFG